MSVDSKRLFALRKAQGLTQVQLADALGTTQRVISYYETDAELVCPACFVPVTKRDTGMRRARWPEVSGISQSRW